MNTQATFLAAQAQRFFAKRSLIAWRLMSKAPSQPRYTAARAAMALAQAAVLRFARPAAEPLPLFPNL
jgi:hypothetical protein